MRALPTKPNKQQREIIEACKDFYGSDKFPTHVALDIMKRKARNKELTKEDKEAAWCIRTNLSDSLYRANLQL